MTDPIPDETVEAVACTLVEHGVVCNSRAIASAALTAAAPHIAAQATSDLRAGIEALRDEWQIAGDGSNSEGRAFRHCARALDALLRGA